MEKEKKPQDKTKKKPMPRRTKLLLWAVAAVFILLLIILGGQLTRMPLAPTMNVVTATPNLTTLLPAETNTPIYVIVTATPQAETAVPSSTPPPTATAANLSFCNESGNMNVLLIGTNDESGVWPPGADFIRVVHIDYTNQTIQMVAFPRDLFSPTTALAAAGMPQQKLGLTYYYAMQQVRGDRKALASYGASVLSRTLLEDFNVAVDHYIVLDGSVVPVLIDDVGGVEVTLTQPVTGYDGLTFPAGRWTLTGSQALNFVSFKTEASEAARLERQQMVMNSFIDKAVNLNILPKLPVMLSDLGSNVVTDLNLTQLKDLGCLATNMDRSRIAYHDLLSGDLVYYAADGTMLPNTPAITSYADQYLH